VASHDRIAGMCSDPTSTVQSAKVARARTKPNPAPGSEPRHGSHAYANTSRRGRGGADVNVDGASSLARPASVTKPFGGRTT
jgi:hypothetical protein